MKTILTTECMKDAAPVEDVRCLLPFADVDTQHLPVSPAVEGHRKLPARNCANAPKAVR